MKKTITLLLLLIVTISGYSQFSKTHYIPPLTGSTYMSSTTIDVDQYIYISTPSTTPVKVTITPLGGKYPVATQMVTNSTPWVYMISAPSIPDPSATPTKPKPDKPAKDGNNTQLFVPSYLLGSVLKDRGYLIEAADFVYANLRVSSKVSSGGSSQAGGLVAKGISAYGTEFRIGGMENRGVMGSGNGEALMNFASFVATEDNTTVTITLPKAPAGTFMYPKTLNGNYPYSYPFPNQDFSYPPAGAPAAVSYTTPTYKNHIYNGPITVTLNKNESYVIAMENSSDNTFESNYMLGGLIKSDRNIVVNCGSLAGSSQIKGEVINGVARPDTGAPYAPYNNAGKDFGFDQIVGADKIGKEFIFVGGSGMATATKAYDLERAIIIANVNGTDVFKYSGTVAAPIKTKVKTLNAGEYYVFNGNDYVGGNLYVTTSENVFAYQAIAGIGSSGKADAGNQNMYFVPPLNCATPSAVNNIPLINEIGLPVPPSTNGKVIYSNTVVNIVTQKFMTDGVTANKVYINGVELTPTTPGLIQRTNVIRETTDIPFVAYSYKTPGGNMAITASAQVYVSYYGSNDNAAFGSYFSGFDTKPSITAPIGIQNSICIDGATPLNVTSAVPTDEFQWNFNGAPIVGAIGNTYTPKSIANGGKGPGYYTVTKKSACTNTESLPIAVSECPANDDTDPVFNNIDTDSDNDGITNTNESYGDLPINLSNPTGGTLTAGGGAYTNTYTGATTPSGSGPNTFTGDVSGNGAFVTSVAPGITNSVTYDLNFNKPTSIGIKYNPAGATVASQSNATFEIKTGLNTNITISNPSNQLLIDTDNDGIFESGVTEFSSFDVKFKLNPTVLLPTTGTPPALDFKIQTYLATSISFTHNNISTSAPNTASFSVIALSVPKDTDGDGIIDQVDTDSDNDGILDIVEGQLGNKVLANADTNKNGLDNNFDPTVAPVDTDADGIPDFIDSDSDNDGISDKIETATNTNASPTNTSGNYRDLDSDGDLCNDVVEAGFVDPDGDGILGTGPATVNADGKVSGGSYTAPPGSPAYYLVAASPTINAQPIQTLSDCKEKTANVVINAVNVSTYKWEVSLTGGPSGTWTTITDGPKTPGIISYSGTTTNTLIINEAVNGLFYRVSLSNAANICKSLVSDELKVGMSGAPDANDISMEKCGSDLSGKAVFKLTDRESDIKTQPAPGGPAIVGETVTYYDNKPDALAGGTAGLINDPTAYTNTKPYNMDVYARVQNLATCSDVATITLTVGVQTPLGYVFDPSLVPTPVCDDVILGTTTNTDGFSAFNLTKVKGDIQALYPPATATTAYTVTLYEKQSDAIAETFPISNISAYRNTTATNQDIWVRVNNSNPAFSTCSGTVQKFFTLNVEALPIPKAVGPFKHCDDDAILKDGKYPFTFGPTSLESQIANGQNVTVTFYDQAGIQLPSPLPNPFLTGNQKIKAVVANADPNGQKCAAAPIFIDFIVDPLPVATPGVFTMCDSDLDGFASFNLTDINFLNRISNNAANEDFTFYSNLTDAQNATSALSSTYTNKTIHTDIIWVRVVNKTTGCFDIAQLDLKVIVSFPSSYKITTAPVCDDDRDGVTTFASALSDAKTTMEALLPPTGYSISFYKNQADANAKSNVITNLTNYRNVGYKDLQDIWIRVDNTISATCPFSAGPYITLNVLKLPNAKAIKELYKECDTDANGQDKTFSFVNTVDNDVRKGRTDVTVDYYDNATGVLLVPSNSTFPSPYTTSNVIVKAVVTNIVAPSSTTPACSDTTFIEFRVDVKPVAVTTPITQAKCDDETDPMKQDGKTSFDASSIQSTILAAQTDPTVMIIKYFAQDGSALPSPLPDAFITKTQTVTYKVENKNNLNNAGCTAQGTIQFTVNPLPVVDLNTDGDDEVVCTNLPGLTFDLTAGTNTAGYTYQWSKDGVVLTGETSDVLQDVNTEGVYTVAVSNGNCPVIRTIKVGASEIAEIHTVLVTDLTDNNTITVNVTGRGNYGYSLDDEIGYYQDSNVFTNVSPGTHTIYVRDRNGCGTVDKAAAVIGVPKFFTPNNDGINDYWNIKGVNGMNYTIFIYDRYGKLLKELIPQSVQGWDGIFNGNLLPGSDYWYSLKLDNGREAKGHFSLKR